MLSAYLVRLVEQHADTLTDELVADLVGNPRTPSFHRLSRDELRDRTYGIYHGLGDWLASTSDATLEARFEALGRQRFHEHVPLAEVVLAATLTKQHLRNKIRSVGNVYAAVELHNEIQLSMMIGRFFDKVLYAIVKGYEHARHEAEHPPPLATASKTPLEKSPAKIEWVP
jgi:hypothetical protein